MEKEAFKFSGEGAINYETYLGPFLFEPSAKLLATLLPKENVQTILEIASGTGRVTKYLRKIYPQPAKLVATDLSADMLEVAKSKLEDNSIEYIVADAMTLPFPDNSFDLVVCQYGVMFFPDRQKGLNEAYRVLKPGGKIFFSTWDNSKSIPIINVVFNKVLLPFFKGEDTSIYLVPFSMSDMALHKELLIKSGFKKIKVDNLKFRGSSPSAQEVVNAFILKHSLGKEISKKNPDALNEIATVALKKIEKEFGTKHIVSPLSAIFARGEK